MEFNFMKKIALLTTVLLASTAAMAGTITNECSTCKVQLNGSDVTASAEVKAGDTLTIKGKPTKISAAQAAQNWKVDAKGQLEAAAAKSGASAAAPSAAPAAEKAATAPAPAAAAPATKN